MKLVLKRKHFKSNYTIGHLYINDKYFCDTLEDKNRDINKNGKFDNGEYKVSNETCIPFGEYEIKMTYAPKFKRELPWLQNVPNFTGILIHSGNTHKHTSGCILVGENTIVGQVCKTKQYEKELVRLIKEAISNKEMVSIEII